MKEADIYFIKKGIRYKPYALYKPKEFLFHLLNIRQLKSVSLNSILAFKQNSNNDRKNPDNCKYQHRQRVLIPYR